MSSLDPLTGDILGSILTIPLSDKTKANTPSGQPGGPGAAGDMAGGTAGLTAGPDLRTDYFSSERKFESEEEKVRVSEDTEQDLFFVPRGVGRHGRDSTVQTGTPDNLTGSQAPASSSTSSSRFFRSRIVSADAAKGSKGSNKRSSVRKSNSFDATALSGLSQLDGDGANPGDYAVAAQLIVKLRAMNMDDDEEHGIPAVSLKTLHD